MTKRIYSILFCVLIIVIIINKSALSQGINTGDQKTYKYFKINACTDDDDVFTTIQYELNIKPLYYAYSIIVNISEIDSLKHYIVFGDENDTSSIRFSFYMLSKETRDKLINWSSLNKFELQFYKKKE